MHYLLLLLLFCASTAWADFSDSDFRMHPAEPLSDPFVLEITGEWPTDCHPGEQKPIISEYTGTTVLIEFETIVEHVTCNDVATHYRVLVDMSDVIDVTDGPNGPDLETTLRFDGTEFTRTISLVCICSPAPKGPDIKPESGLYDSQNLEKQGLLVARQNERMAVYPLIYDDAGSSEWLFGAGGIDEDVFFSDLYELTGGQCLGCAPPEDPAQLNVVGKITMLMDSAGVTQVKVNDGLFIAYEQSEFGYGSRIIGGNPTESVPDLSGRWAFIGDSAPLLMGSPTPSETEYLPDIFDLRLESIDAVPPNIGGIPPYMAPGHAVFSIWDTAGNQYAQMMCTYPPEWNEHFQEEMRGTFLCEVTFPGDDNGEPIYTVETLSVERLSFIWEGPAVGLTPTKPVFNAVRIDEVK